MMTAPSTKRIFNCASAVGVGLIIFVSMFAVGMVVADLAMPVKCIDRADIIVVAAIKSTVTPLRFACWVHRSISPMPCDQFAHDISSRTRKLLISRQTPAILL
jgi:hypothetical protein